MSGWVPSGLFADLIPPYLGPLLCQDSFSSYLPRNHGMVISKTRKPLHEHKSKIVWIRIKHVLQNHHWVSFCKMCNLGENSPLVLNWTRLGLVNKCQLLSQVRKISVYNYRFFLESLITFLLVLVSCLQIPLNVLCQQWYDLKIIVICLSFSNPYTS